MLTMAKKQTNKQTLVCIQKMSVSFKLNIKFLCWNVHTSHIHSVSEDQEAKRLKIRVGRLGNLWLFPVSSVTFLQSLFHLCIWAYRHDIIQVEVSFILYLYPINCCKRLHSRVFKTPDVSLDGVICRNDMYDDDTFGLNWTFSRVQNQTFMKPAMKDRDRVELFRDKFGRGKNSLNQQSALFLKKFKLSCTKRELAKWK